MNTARATIMVDRELHARLAGWCRALGVAPDAVVEELLADLPEPPKRDPLRRPASPRAVTSAGHERLITHAELVRRLAADREANGLGDAGARVVHDVAPTLIGPATGTREYCAAHGWVGRHRFEADNHAHCVETGEPCRSCRGHRFTTAGDCRRCGGTGLQRDALERGVSTGTPAFVAPEPRGKRNRPTRTAPRSHTLSTKQLSRSVLRAFDEEIDETDSTPTERPRTRAECPVERPCPWVSCRYNLFLDVLPETGSLKLNWPDKEPDEVEHSCALDAADAGGQTLEQVAERMNLTRERIRQLETKAAFAMRAGLHRERIYEEHARDLGREEVG